MPLVDNFQRAVQVSTINAVLKHMGLIGGTVHCRDGGPKECTGQIAEWIKEQDAMNVGLIGLQHALLEARVKALGSDRVVVSDLWRRQAR